VDRAHRDARAEVDRRAVLPRGGVATDLDAERATGEAFGREHAACGGRRAVGAAGGDEEKKSVLAHVTLSLDGSEARNVHPAVWRREVATGLATWRGSRGLQILESVGPVVAQKARN